MAATPNIYIQKIPTITIPCFIKHSRKLNFIVGNSNSETAVGADETSPVELRPGTPSIISALNVEKALLGIGASTGIFGSSPSFIMLFD